MCKCVNRLVLVIVNVLFALAGAAILGVSIWILVGSSSLFDLVKLVTNDLNVDDATLNNYINSTSMLKAAAWVLLCFGGVSMLVGVCGCIGAMCKSKILLGLYSVLVVIILLAEIGGAIAIAVFKGQIESKLQPQLKTLEEKHFMPLNLTVNMGQNTTAVISALINYAQVSFECCGVTNQTDITASGTAWSNAVSTHGLNLKVPVTCCPMKNRDQLLSKQDWSNYKDYLSDSSCPTSGSNSITVGCYDKLDSSINTYTVPIIIVAIVVALCEVLCVVMACSLIQAYRQEDKHV